MDRINHSNPYIQGTTVLCENYVKEVSRRLIMGITLLQKVYTKTTHMHNASCQGRNKPRG